MALCRTLYAVRILETCIEPLWRIGGTHLTDQHIGNLVIKSLGILLGIEVAMFFSPLFPAADKAVNNLLDRMLTTGHRLPFLIQHDITLLIPLWHPCFSEILLRENISGNLGPLFRHFYIIHFKYLRSIGVSKYR